jgi:hypothetical protein
MSSNRPRSRKLFKNLGNSLKEVFKSSSPQPSTSGSNQPPDVPSADPPATNPTTSLPAPNRPVPSEPSQPLQVPVFNPTTPNPTTAVIPNPPTHSNTATQSNTLQTTSNTANVAVSGLKTSLHAFKQNANIIPALRDSIDMFVELINILPVRISTSLPLDNIHHSGLGSRQAS